MAGVKIGGVVDGMKRDSEKLLSFQLIIVYIRLLASIIANIVSVLETK